MNIDLKKLIGLYRTAVATGDAFVIQGAESAVIEAAGAEAASIQAYAAEAMSAEALSVFASK